MKKIIACFMKRLSFAILFACFLFSCNDSHKFSKPIEIVWAKEYSEDELDFLCEKDTSYIYPNNTVVLTKDMNFYALSDNDFSLAKNILKEYFAKHLYEKAYNKNETPLQFSEYFRQYIGYTINGSLHVYVNLFTHLPVIPEPDCLCTIVPSQRVLIYEDNGGVNYGTVIINMDKKEVVSFKLSDTDSDFITGNYSDMELKVLFPSVF